MSAHAPSPVPGGRIGPNAVTQFVPLLEALGGPVLRDRILSSAGILELPSMDGLMAEGPVIRLHRVIRASLPDDAAGLSRSAGERTADYILANRIPQLVQAVLRALPPRLAGPLLIRAIDRNAWTFVGSGRFETCSSAPWTLTIRDNPVARGETGTAPLCHWHLGVFERLFCVLVDDRCRVEETACCGCGSDSCRFVVSRPA